ncbi:unnamed protein product [Caenorhabditis angaria]|uniref:Uncharacterized protein n=1 Tax=Caenorhabditis angaria TaxID=860376 RepID=A0A9P1MYV0_9PELO|nr:unnamed protein product [Caenorhabditis angaria]
MENAEVVNRIMEEMKNGGIEDFNLEDPFDDPTLVTTAFLDIAWQDEHGNTALMIAAAENRILQVKGILTMAIKSGKFWTIVDMRNNEGLNSVQMAVRANSETCAMLITKVMREYGKLKPRPRSREELNHEEDITFEMGTEFDKEVDKFGVRDVIKQKSTDSMVNLGPPKRLNREKLSNNLKNIQKGHEYLQMVKRSRSAHSRLMSQRTFSVESTSIEGSDPGTPSIPIPPQDHGVFSTMGEKIRNIFSRKPPMHSNSLNSNSSITDRLPSASGNRTSSSADKHSSYHDSRSSAEDNNIRLPQQSSDIDDNSTSARIFPWASSSSLSHSSSSGAPKTQGMMQTPNGVRLPPLSMRRRASSDPKNRDFHSLGFDDN